MISDTSMICSEVPLAALLGPEHPERHLQRTHLSIVSALIDICVQKGALLRFRNLETRKCESRSVTRNAGGDVSGFQPNVVSLGALLPDLAPVAKLVRNSPRVNDCPPNTCHKEVMGWLLHPINRLAPRLIALDFSGLVKPDFVTPHAHVSVASVLS